MSDDGKVLLLMRGFDCIFVGVYGIHLNHCDWGEEVVKEEEARSWTEADEDIVCMYACAGEIAWLVRC